MDGFGGLGSLISGVGGVSVALGLLKWLLDRHAKRIAALEQLVDLLRRELDNSLIRGSAATSIARILLLAVDQTTHPTPAMIAARQQAAEVLETAHAHTHKKGK